MQLNERAASYASAYPRYPPVHVHGRFLYGVWMMGQDYQGSGFYGAFPPRLLDRLWSLFPDLEQDRFGARQFGLKIGRVLHVFSGSLTKRATRRVGQLVVRVDLQRKVRVRPDVRGDALNLPFASKTFQLVTADPPYGAMQAERYGIRMPSRRLVLRELWRVTRPGGHLAWLDVQLPMYRKREWHLYGTIAIIRSTNHVVRLLSLFSRR